MRDQIRQAVLAVKREQGFRFRPAEEIQERAVQEAIQRFAPGVRPEDVLLMMDITGESLGSEGFLLTEQGLYSSLFPQQSLALDGLTRAELEPGKQGRVLCGYSDGTSRSLYIPTHGPYIAAVLTAVIGVLQGRERPAAKKLSPLEQAIARRLAQKKQAERRKEEQKGAGSEPAPEALQHTRQGLQAYRSGDYVQALEAFRQAAQQGDAQAQFWMGRVCLPIMPRP